MFRITRSPLLSRIWELSKTNSVLITGSPGSGKSWAIAQFVRQCKTEKRPCLPLIAEDFSVDSLDQLRTALGFKSDILSFVTSLSNEPVVIIDGLDALRSEPSQRTFRELIRQISQRAPKCTIVASIRSFDLQQSEELKTLFFSGSAAASSRSFQQVTVPPLTDADVLQAIAQAPALKNLVESATGEFRALLRNPFNLHLALQLLETGVSSDELSHLHTQVQLLTKYWDWRIESRTDSHDRKRFLRTLLEKMVAEKSLSVHENSVYETGQGGTLTELQSDEILKESVTNRLSFVHNILFDYGLARLLLDERNIESFIQADQSRTIFFRPSLAYFFHYLWFRDRSLFWSVADGFFASSVLPERARILPAVAICEAARIVEDLEPLLPEPLPARISGVTSTLRSLQALQGLRGPFRKMWIELLFRLSQRLDVAFINEYIALMGQANESKSNEEVPLIFASATALLRWIWTTAETLKPEGAVSIASVAAGRVMPVVIKNYGQDIAESRVVVTEVLKRFGSPRSSPQEAFFLANGLGHIAKSDPETAVEVCRAIFAFDEQSQEKTQIGSGTVMSFTSTRAQDFSSARYSIQSVFTAFLEASPVHAATAAVRSLNAEISRERPTSRRQDDETPAEFTFNFAGTKVHYRSDYSEIWDTGSRDYQSINLFIATLHAVSKLLEESRDEKTARAMVVAISRDATFAVAWKRLLQASVFNTPSIYPVVRELFRVPELLSAPETTVVAGEALKAAYAAGLIGKDDARKIEEAILKIPDAVAILRYEKPESIRNRLLMCIPGDQLQSEPLKKLFAELSESKQVRANEPYHRMTFEQRAFGTEDFLREQGVDPSSRANAELLEALKPLQSFEHKYMNQVPSTDECERIESQVVALRALLVRGDAAEKVRDTANGALCAVAETILNNDQLKSEQSVVKTSREIVLSGAKSSDPKFDPKYHLPFELPSWGGPLARIEAAQGLSHYLWHWGLEVDVVTAFLRLAEDEVPAVRFQIAEGLAAFYKHEDKETFWKTLTKMFAAEETPGVLLALLQTLWRVSGIETDRAESILLNLFGRDLPKSDRSELTRTMMQMLVGLHVVRDRSASKDQLCKFEEDPLHFHREVTEEIYAAAAYIRGPNAKEPETRSRAREIFTRVVTSVYNRILIIQQEPRSPENYKALGDMLYLLDHVATRLFFSLDKVSTSGDSTQSDESGNREHYFDIKPLLELLANSPLSAKEHLLLPQTAHYLMQTFNQVLSYDPVAVITYSAAVCRAATQFSYQYDPMAIDEMTKLVERVLADHKDILRNPVAASAIGEMLDTFVTASWPAAMTLTFRLDEAIR